ncbi:hypothetical protein [Caulobacter sp.]|uniref:hypothetical protein n=1 Tax=Caulobacter sp. TaxID=78 RepID=UPI001B246149|nr:hypothetical protein [Caulobacter sp.]MBO9545342.1 hypothetical protein [Caulobacter sp.]
MTKSRSNVERWSHSVAILVLGVVFPILVLIQAYGALSKLTPAIVGWRDGNGAEEIFAKVQPQLKSANDYALYTVMRLEATNNAVVTNKQIMKVVIMHLGFAVVSVGLMFIVLGIETKVGGGEGVIEAVGLKVDFRTASTGVLVFVVGATMVTLGGVLRNEYSTVGVPGYVTTAGPDAKAQESLARFKFCEKNHPPEDLAACFAPSYYEINEEALK